MKKKEYKRKSRTYHKWLLSYVLLMVFPLLFGCVIYWYAMERIEEDVEYVQRQTLTQIKNTMEGNLYMCDHIGLALTKKTEAEHLKAFEQDRSYSVWQRLYPKALVEDMLLYAASNEMIDEVMLYFPKTDYILKQSRFCPLEYSKIKAENDYKMTLEELRSLSQKGKNGLHALDNGENGLLYVYSAYEKREKLADITVLIYLNTSVIREFVSLAQSSVFLSLADGSWFSSSGQEFPAEWEQIAQEQGDYALSSGKQNYIMKLRSETYKLGFLNVIEKRLYLKGVNRMKLILAVYVMASIVGGIGIAWYVSKRNYQPVKELLELTGEAMQDVEDGNDFSVIRGAYQKLLSAYQDKEARLRESRAGEKNSWMNELLKGRSSNITAAIKGFDTWAKEMQYDSFALLGVDLVDMGSMQEEEAEEISTEVMDMAYFIVDNILGELLSERYQAVEAETDGKLFALVNVNDQFDQKKVIQDLKAISQKTDEFIRKNFGIKLMINISQIREGKSQIRNCYKDIEELLEYRDFEGISEETILARSDYKKEVDERRREGELHFGQVLGRLKYHLQQEEYEKAQELIAGLQKDRQKEEQKKEKESRQTSGKKEGGKKETEEFKQEIRQEEEKKEKKQIDQLIDQIAAYIEAHYTDDLLSAGVLADEFNIGLSYMSRSFKKRKGIGILDYINQFRLNRAKELLAEGATVREAAEQVGYYTTQPLIRVFRQMEGMTPSEYRNNHCFFAGQKTVEAVKRVKK
ncbi:MAG: helix-turn-helix transcriptional regulator [Lachnospiraceae bacterium]|jgi:AraC-like DNA-binding protein|nr:helix-turn-helix transcriptional regulator [Lachnospiraceae bacterium]